MHRVFSAVPHLRSLPKPDLEKKLLTAPGWKIQWPTVYYVRNHTHVVQNTPTMENHTAVILLGISNKEGNNHRSNMR